MLLNSDEIDGSQFASVDDVAQKLARTVVLYKGSPVYVHEILNIDSLGVRGSRDHAVVQVDIKDIDYQAPKLGLFYDDNRRCAILPIRYTTRQYRGGLPPDSVYFKECKGNYAGNEYRSNDIVFGTLLSDGFKNMLKNVYPTVTKCLDEIQSDKNIFSMPFRRYHWIGKTKSKVTMWFKGFPIIEFDHKTKEFTEPQLAEYVNSALRSVIQSQIQEFKNHESFV